MANHLNVAISADAPVGVPSSDVFIEEWVRLINDAAKEQPITVVIAETSSKSRNVKNKGCPSSPAASVCHVSEAQRGKAGSRPRKESVVAPVRVGDLRLLRAEVVAQSSLERSRVPRCSSFAVYEAGLLALFRSLPSGH